MNYVISPYRYGVCDTCIAKEVLIRIQINIVINQITPVTTTPSVLRPVTNFQPREWILMPWSAIHFTLGCHPLGADAEASRNTEVAPELISLSLSLLSVLVTTKFFCFNYDSKVF